MYNCKKNYVYFSKSITYKIYKIWLVKELTILDVRKIFFSYSTKTEYFNVWDFYSNLLSYFVLFVYRLNFVHKVFMCLSFYLFGYTVKVSNRCSYTTHNEHTKVASSMRRECLIKYRRQMVAVLSTLCIGSWLDKFSVYYYTKYI